MNFLKESKGDVVNQVLQITFEAILQAEQDEFLGYGYREKPTNGNKRNGYRLSRRFKGYNDKTFRIIVPRDRYNLFKPFILEILQEENEKINDTLYQGIKHRRNTLEVGFCLEALEKALKISKPEIFNSDQGSQFTSNEFTGRLEEAGIRISMDDRGRVFDNIFIERLWRTLKYEEVYTHSYETVREAKENLGRYFRFYNEERLHESLGYKTPKEVYFGQGKTFTGQAGIIHLKQPCFLS